MASHNKSSEELEREIEARRARIENRVDEISARLSPGQLLDEALQYTRHGPGADFTRNLGRSVVENPLPVALMGASLAWLAVQSNMPKREREPDYRDDDRYDGLEDDEEDYPVALITGPTITRTGTSETEGNRYAEFADSAGRKFKAMTNETGHRAGHFADETGRMFRGFVDESGHRISDFRDETGNRFHQATGWAAHNWRKAGRGFSSLGRNMRDGAQHLGHSVRDGAGHLGERAGEAGYGVRRQGEHAVHAADDFIHEQPLVSGAIAFALGALIGGFLPHTRQEDEIFGRAADSVKREAAHEAEHLYERGREEAEHLHDQARDAAGKTYEKAKEAVRQGTDDAKAKATATSDTAIQH